MQNKPKLFSEFPPISIAEWEKQIRKDLKGQDYDKKLLWETLDGFILKPYYSEKDLLPLDYLNSISPHLMPSDGHLISNSWIMHQEILESDPLKANKLAVKAIKGGMNHISFNASEIKNLSKLNVLLKGIDIIEISIGFYNQECNRFLRNLLTEFAVSNNFNKLKIRGNFEADPYGILLSTGDYRENPGQLKRHYYELIDSLDTHLPNFRGITIHGQQFHNGGATSTQELAYVLALGVEYLSMLTEQELPIDSITPFLQLSFGIGSDYFIEIAKIRAARLLWSKMVEQYSPKKKDSNKIFIHAETSSVNKSIYDSHTNMLRVTTEAMSAIIGGVDSLYIKPFDHLYKLPNEFSARIAKNVQLLLKEESYLDKVVDPSSGSYYIENMTDQLAQSAWKLFKTIEKEGGYLIAIEKGIIQNQIMDSVNKRKEQLLNNKEHVLGASLYPNTNERIFGDMEISEFDNDESGQTRFQIIKPYRKAVPFEQLRLKTERYIAKGNKAPLVFMLPVGNPSRASARQNFARNFFGCAGFDIIENDHFTQLEKGIKQSIQVKANLIIACSSDEEYPIFCPEILKQLSKNKSNAKLIVAGFPKDSTEELKNMGVYDFIHLRTKLVKSLTEYQKLFKII